MRLALVTGASSGIGPDPARLCVEARVHARATGPAEDQDKEEGMSDDDTKRGRAQDRRLVAGQQDHEVRYEAEKMDVSPDKVREAVKSEGNSRAKVERKLKDD